ncbi:MAG TPA: pilus (MSHA type) biogenesis protein MshL [Burkholderiales bacterium]|jgi:MSHA biogenesis protein MshL|nr:pilus (MSHA type) biogenesis protein MshL [Burkholderiales bacterium]
MPRTALVILAMLAAGCSTSAHRPPYESAQRELDKAAGQPLPAAQPPAVSEALLPPIAVQMPSVDGKPIEPRFDLEVNNAPASQVFMAIVSGTRYSMVVHPSVKDAISLNLKDVTVFEALDTIRDLYGYEYKVQGTRILIQPLGLQTRVFEVSYLLSQRKGRTEVRITSGAISDSTPSGVQGSTNVQLPGTTTSRALESSRVTTTSEADFWAEIGAAVRALIGTEGGRNVVVSPQAGALVVRAYPAELRSVEEFLNSMSSVVERQVMLEAKIIEVQLSDEFQTGINWAAFRSGDNSRAAGGVLAPGTTLRPTGSLSGFTASNPDGTVNVNSALTSTPGAITGSITAGTGTPGTLFGLAFQTSNFATLLSFLETQGKLQVLSSPRIATINNQKAVLKVGTDEFFVTNVTTNVTTTGTTSTQSPTITVQPFFSGVALDVTPQIDKDNFITLHIHPSVSNVIERTKDIDLGTAGNFRLPLASSTISETDTIVRVADGNLVAIGGLMKETQVRDKGQVPGLGDVPIAGNLFRNQRRQSVKSELVILLKPTVIQGPASWRQDILDTKQRIDSIQRGDSPGSGPNAPASSPDAR